VGAAAAAGGAVAGAGCAFTTPASSKQAIAPAQGRQQIRFFGVIASVVVSGF
jgi:hypothetical protein